MLFHHYSRRSPAQPDASPSSLPFSTLTTLPMSPNLPQVLRMEARLHGLDYGPSTAPVAPEATTREEKLALNKR